MGLSSLSLPLFYLIFG